MKRIDSQLWREVGQIIPGVSIRGKENALYTHMSSCRTVVVLVLLLLSLVVQMDKAVGDLSRSLYDVSPKTYDITYDDILKMYLRVMPAKCRGQSTRRHDLYNWCIHDELSHYMEGVLTPEYDRLDEEAKAAKRKEMQEKTLQYIKSRVGYAILDINGDGIDEMIIGRDGSYIYELFTMDDGKVRELIKAGSRYQCNLLQDGGLFRHVHDGGGLHGNLLYRMNGTSKVVFEKGYYHNIVVGYDQNHLDDGDCWFKIADSKNRSKNTMAQHVPSSEANSWIADCESNYAQVRFIPLSAFEKGMSGDGVAVLSVKGKTSGSQKVRIRKKPDSKVKILVQKRVGTYVKAVGLEGDYYQISVDGKTGYVHKDYITLITELPAGGDGE